MTPCHFSLALPRPAVVVRGRDIPLHGFAPLGRPDSPPTSPVGCHLYGHTRLTPAHTARFDIGPAPTVTSPLSGGNDP